jgi:prepilin-type N-terminal cleavage/methylation domain-containing protein
MKTSLKANLLKHLIAKKEEGGFTLIELLVVIIIIGILAAIALPSFLNQANKAKQSEAKTYVGSMNRAQQAYYLENSTFALQQNFSELGLGIKTETTNYSYSISTAPVAIGGANAAIRNYGVPKDINGQKSSVKAYGGGVSIGSVTTAGTTEATTQAILCEGIQSPIQGGAQTTANIDAEVTFTAAGGANTPGCAATPVTGMKVLQ